MKEKFDYSLLVDKIMASDKYKSKDFIDRSATMCNNAKVKICSLRWAMQDKYHFTQQEIFRIKNELELTDQEVCEAFFKLK